MNRTKTIFFSTLLAGTFAASSVSAESLEDKEKWAKQDGYMVDPVKGANEKCGITDEKKLITYSFDKASFAKEDWGSHSPNGYCSGVFENLDSLCRNMEAAKPEVQAKIKKVVCKFGGKGKFSIKLAGGTLTYTVDWDEANVGEKITTYLKKSL